ncbi:hypothetical protein PHLCEN_2v13460 [Hermanssonia centrifuga]|uniref:Uncharacterized protein n=1 Tax=Hermanssonia centrifuga TaxID=98765 RepID=A0A2R6NE67_9APHY|nr:hypothetical protein PHLCEN_2v13460 [Hermanssonia centrifuga]
MSGFRFPRVLVCGPEISDDSNDNSLPLWYQITIALARTYIQTLQIDVAAHISPALDLAQIKATLSQLSPEINTDGLTTTPATGSLSLKAHHTHVVLCGITPLSSTPIPPDVTAIYIPTPSSPVSPAFPFDQLGSRGFVVLLEPEARNLLNELDPATAAGSAVTTLRARALVRSLVARSSLKLLQGVVIARGEHAVDGCVASAKVMVPPPFDDDDDVDDEDTEERYEFDIPKPIFEGPLETEGAYAAFAGKFIASLVTASASMSPVSVHSESSFSFQLELASVAAVTTALRPSSSPTDLVSRIPTLSQLDPNIQQYMFGRPLLRPGEPVPPRGARPVQVQISWPATALSPPTSPILGAFMRGRGMVRGAAQGRGR